MIKREFLSNPLKFLVIFLFADEVLTVGTTCKNAGCKAEYKSPKSNEEVCVYHTGSPVFHEGNKR